MSWNVQTSQIEKGKDVINEIVHNVAEVFLPKDPVVFGTAVITTVVTTAVPQLGAIHNAIDNTLNDLLAKAIAHDEFRNITDANVKRNIYLAKAGILVLLRWLSKKYLLKEQKDKILEVIADGVFFTPLVWKSTMELFRTQ